MSARTSGDQYVCGVAGMTDGAGRSRQRPAPASVPSDTWLVGVADGASRDAGGVPVQLLGDYLPMLADAAIHGRQVKKRELDAVGRLGRQAAEQGISAGRVVQLYLSAARRLWEDLPIVVRSRDREAVRAAAAAVLQVVDKAVATLAEGYADARRDLVRREETLRRELIDDLVRGDSDVGALVERAEPFGLDLARSHQVALAAPSRRLPDADTAISALEAVVFDRLGDRDVLVATKEGLLVVIAPADPPAAGRSSSATGTGADLGALMHSELNRLPRGRPWRVAVGRAHPGLYGIARSYEEAREALTMAGRLNTDNPVTSAHDLLIYRVLLRDQPAIVDLVQAVLTPLAQARGGAAPLLDTLDAYFASGTVATEAAKQLHISVRTVTYRLARVKALTGYDPADPTHRFTLQAAVLGAKLLNWPRVPLPAPG
ncbi:helix-turn-helix domain-containing protein [Actinoplanes sp. NPDC023936]|uniref:PucR family transcriptional regulator n=1 Tax=Actinoplanes sp. NPDC023936 TaxID=3154910 RepID=UPI0033DB8AB2